MHLETGEVKEFTEEEYKKLSIGDRSKLIEIDKSLMSEKQQQNMRVSLKDNKSELGKVLVSARTLCNREKRRRRKLK